MVRKTVSQILRKQVLDRRDFTTQLMGLDRAQEMFAGHLRRVSFGCRRRGLVHGIGNIGW